MRHGRLAAIALCVGISRVAAGQSTLLTALEGSPPAPTLDPTAAALTKGLAVLWADPTAEPRATGVFLGMSYGSYAAVHVFHGAVAFRLGPRWSVASAPPHPGPPLHSP